MTITTGDSPTRSVDETGAGLEPARDALVRRRPGAHRASGQRTAGRNDQNLTLGGRAARGAAVTLAGQLTRILLQMSTVVVLSRLLLPADYGLVAMVLVVVGIGTVFRDFGLTTAAVQARTVSREQRTNLVWVNTGIGVVLASLMFLGAKGVAAVFGEPRLVLIAQVLAVTFLLNGFATQYRADLTRRMKWGRLALADLLGQCVGLVIAVVLAVKGAGYWALVSQQVGQLACTAALLIYFAGWLPGTPNRAGDLRPFIKFGSNLAITQLIYYIMNNLDTFTIGLRFSTESLGLYNRGFSLLMSPLNQVRSPATTVALPVLSRLQTDYERAGDYLRRSQLALGYSIVAALSISAGASVPLTGLLLGPRWSAVAPILGCLAIAGAASTLAYVGLWVYLSRGMGRALMHYTLATLVLQAACIFGGSHWGVNGVAAGYMVAALIEWPLSIGWLSRLTVIPARALVLGGLRISLCGAMAGAAAFATSRLLAGHANWFVSVACIAVGIGVYALAAATRAVRADVRDVASMARSMIKG